MIKRWCRQSDFTSFDVWKYKRNTIGFHQNFTNKFRSNLQLTLLYKRIYQMEKQQDQVAPEIITKDLIFKEYSSLEIATRDKFVKKIRESAYDNKDILWVASEKIHGSNFSIHYNGQNVRYGRRTDFLTKDIPVPCDKPGVLFNESFYDAKTLVVKFHNRLNEVFDNIKKVEPQLLKIAIYGEYFGGNWPLDHPAYVKGGPKQVQKGIYYTPHHQFYAFDIFIVTVEKMYWADVLDIPKYLGDIIPAVPIYSKGTFDQVFKINTQIDSTIPQLLGFPKLENNICEGMVIRPNSNLTLPTYNERVIIKKKNKEFMEKASAPNPAKKEKEVDPEIAGYLAELIKYVNVNRINSVVSKFPDLKDRAKLKDLVSIDVLTDADKDEFKLPEDQQKRKKVIKQLNGAIIKQINAYFIKH